MMKTSTSKLIAIASIAGTAWAAGGTHACGSGFKVSFGGGRGHVSIGHHRHHQHNHHHHSYVRKVYVKPVYVAPIAPCIHPLHSFCFVYPGDTWTLLSLREYGKPNFGATIAAFNGMSSSVRLVVGQELRLPVIHPNGSLTPSSSPAPAPFVLPSPPVVAQPLAMQDFAPAQQGQLGGPRGESMPPQGMQFTGNGSLIGPQGPLNGSGNGPMNMLNAQSSQPQAPPANIRVASDERLLTTVASGSILSLDGQSLGNEKGIVRLRINGLAMPVEVLDWSAESATIRLPELDLERRITAEIEVLRADGSLASKTAIELTSAATRLALSN
jgi:hypothetical protein